jgi:hypothetical protein
MGKSHPRALWFEPPNCKATRRNFSFSMILLQDEIAVTFVQLSWKSWTLWILLHSVTNWSPLSITPWVNFASHRLLNLRFPCPDHLRRAWQYSIGAESERLLPLPQPLKLSNPSRQSMLAPTPACGMVQFVLFPITLPSSQFRFSSIPMAKLALAGTLWFPLVCEESVELGPVSVGSGDCFVFTVGKSTCEED